MPARERLKPTCQILAHLSDPCEKSGSRDFLHHGAADSGCERIAIEGTALIAVIEATDALARDQRSQRNSSAQSLAKRHDVGRDSGVLESEEFSGAADSGLDFVKDEQQAYASGQRVQIAQEIIACAEHARLTLDRLEHDGDGVGGDRALDLRDVSERHFHETLDFGREQMLLPWLSRRRHRG